mmetsp:Transcript_81917/g.211075  ORF Transcript_81917/g.211075 Transcript_81917/m.211075 type:complete len:301 (+) Transcript_81917:328-1230(+)
MCTAAFADGFLSCGTRRAIISGRSGGGGGGAPASSAATSAALVCTKRVRAYQSSNSSNSVSFSASSDRKANSSSSWSREPSSCRIGAGSPKNSATSSSFRQALISKRLLILDWPETSHCFMNRRSLSRTLPSGSVCQFAACGGSMPPALLRGDRSPSVGGTAPSSAPCEGEGSSSDSTIAGGSLLAFAILVKTTWNCGFRYHERGGARVAKRPPPCITACGRCGDHSSSTVCSKRQCVFGAFDTSITSTGSSASTTSLKGPSSPLAAETTTKIGDSSLAAASSNEQSGISSSSLEQAMSW